MLQVCNAIFSLSKNVMSHTNILPYTFRFRGLRCGVVPAILFATTSSRRPLSMSMRSDCRSGATLPCNVQGYSEVVESYADDIVGKLIHKVGIHVRYKILRASPILFMKHAFV